MAKRKSTRSRSAASPAPRKTAMAPANACPPSGRCCKCSGIKWLVLGILVLLNVYLVVLSWPEFLGWLFVLHGLAKVVVPQYNK